MNEPGRVLSAHVKRPGAAAQIAANGWHCAFPKCEAPVTCEVVFYRACRGRVGYTRGSHGACDAHADAYARAMGDNRL